jgi:enterochelin esterase-like enzyme
VSDGVSDQPEPYLPSPETQVRRNGVPAGTLSAARVYESRAAYSEHRFEYRIYVPAQYSPGRPVALSVFQDGGLYLGRQEARFDSVVTFDNLIASGDIPVMLALFINPGTPSGSYHHPRERALRSLQYDALDDRYARFLIEEAVPDLVTSRYDVVTDAEGWSIAGHSSGGIAAFTVAWQYPDKFRKVLTHNASFVNIRGGDAYPALIRSTAPKPLRVSLLSGSADSNNEYGCWFDANQAMASALEARGYRHRFRRGHGAHYPPVQAVADYPDALRWLWAGYRLPI